jgi:signal transduction histidine kinase
LSLDCDDYPAGTDQPEEGKSWPARLRHDLRTPLNAILGYCSMMAEDAEDMNREDLLEHLAVIRTNGRRMLHLIRELLPSENDNRALEAPVEVYAALQSGITPCLTAVNESTGRLLESAGTVNAVNFEDDARSVLTAAAHFTRLLESAAQEDEEIRAWVEGSPS